MCCFDLFLKLLKRSDKVLPCSPYIFFLLTLSVFLPSAFFPLLPPSLHIWFAHFRQNPCKVHTLFFLQMTSSVLVTQGSMVRSFSEGLRLFQCCKGNACITFILGLQSHKIIQKQQYIKTRGCVSKRYVRNDGNNDAFWKRTPVLVFIPSVPAWTEDGLVSHHSLTPF